MDEENKEFDFTYRFISGKNMDNILETVKDYIDIRDIVFKNADEETIKDASDESYCPECGYGFLDRINLTLTGQFVREEDIEDIINKYFIIK